MKASENDILRLLNGTDKRFIIPIYQRPYSWKKEHCVQLMKDLHDVCEYDYQSHFFGSIVFVAQSNGSVFEHIIIDGQQRLTTVSLLLLAIRNYVVAESDKNININPKKVLSYLIDEYADEDKKLKLKLVQGDDIAYEKLVEAKTPVSDSHITTNYDYFYEKISQMSVSEIEALYEAISKLNIVCISLMPSEGDDPQLIFESMNSTGKGLEPSDKIRNYVLMRMTSKEQERFYRKYWQPLEDIIPRKDMDKFIRYFLNVKLRRNVAERNLYLEFKNYKENSDMIMDAILEDILCYAKYYKTICFPIDEKSPYSDVLQRITKLEVNTSIPLMLDIMNAVSEGAITQDEAYQSFEIIENYIVRREVCNLETNQLNKIFVSLGAEIERDIEDDNISYFEAFKREILKKSGKARFPNNHDFEDRFIGYELYNAKPSMKKYILERLENFGTKERIAVEEQIADGTLTIEHIMPQTLTPEWKKELGDTWELIHSKYIDTPGNITLTAYNSDYSNSSFQTKKNLPEKGFSFSKLSLNASVKVCDVWGEEQIIERANQLYQAAAKIWWIPSVDQQIVHDNDWVNWDEDYDYTDKVITMVSVLGAVIKVSTVTDAYKKVHETLFDVDPMIYKESQFSWFKEKRGELTKPYKIGNNAYIETNRNSQQKMDYIAAVAKALELESDDIKFMTSTKTDAFNVRDELTYGNVAVGRMAYEMIKDLLEHELISDDEIELLKTKEYTKQLFNKTDYPALADSRDANKGNSNLKRYRANPVKYRGKDIFITFQWFADNRQDIIDWYQKHINAQS